MICWSTRSLLNVVYAYLLEQREARDAVLVPVLLSVGVESKEVAKMSARDALDEWLNQPAPDVQQAEQAVLKALTG